MLCLQHAAGNAATAELIRRGPEAVRNLANHRPPAAGHETLVQRDPTGGGVDVVKDIEGRLKDWRTNANAGVGEAVHGTLEQRIKDATAFNSQALVGAVLGNVIWALASFATGGLAFAISLAGIATGTATQIPRSPSTKTPVADIEEAMYQQLDTVQQNARDGAQQLVDKATANGLQLTLADAMRQIFAPGQLTASATPDIDPAKVRAAYRKSAEALFAQFDSEVDPIGTELDVSGPDPFVKKTTKIRLDLHPQPRLRHRLSPQRHIQGLGLHPLRVARDGGVRQGEGGELRPGRGADGRRERGPLPSATHGGPAADTRATVGDRPARCQIRHLSALSTSSTNQAGVGHVPPHEHYVQAEEFLKAAAEHPDPSASETL